MKILIIKLGALGDMVIASPVIQRIVEHHVDDEVWLLTTPPFHGLFENRDDLQVHSLPRKGLNSAWQQIKWVRQQGFSCIYDLQSNDRTSIICALSGCDNRIGNHPRFPYHIHPPAKFVGQCHSFERLNQVLTAAGIQAADPTPRLAIDNNHEKKVNSWLKENGLDENRFVIMHAGSSPQHQHKRWPLFADLARELIKQGLQTVWVGTNDDATLNREFAEITGINATNIFCIQELASLGTHARFSVTNDSAPMHILACSGTPVYGLFGPTNPRRTHAIGQHHRVIFAGGAVPADDAGFKPADMNNIQLDTVLEKLRADEVIPG